MNYINRKHKNWSNLYVRQCELNCSSKIRMTHIGGDYIGVEADGEYYEIERMGQHIIWELMRRLDRMNQELGRMERITL